MSDFELLRLTFESTFGAPSRPFGASGGQWIGVSDDAKGVQWNAPLDRLTGTAMLGINLEGMAYDGWPIARFIERELAQQQLTRMRDEFGDIVVSLMRDCWQVAVRLSIAEHQIGERAPLSKLTPEQWRDMLREAYGCLDPQRNHRGRARQTVTLASGRTEKSVSPHLHLGRVIWQATPSVSEAARAMRSARDSMKPLYQLIQRLSR